MVLVDELLSLVVALDDGGVEYALVGGLALAVWGAPRATKDIDLLVRPERLDAAMAIALTQGFDVVAMKMTFRDGMELQRVTRAQGGQLLTLDFLLVSAPYEAAWSSRLRVAVGAGGVWVISRDALIAMKALAARPQDIADIERLRDLDR